MSVAAILHQVYGRSLKRKSSHVDYFVVTGCTTLQVITTTTSSPSSSYKVVNVNTYPFQRGSMGVVSQRKLHIERNPFV